jgi:sugar phosphate isomerase/epimerase
MTQFSVNEVTTYRWTFEEDVYAYRKHGFQGIGLWRPKVAEFGFDKAREFLEEEGLIATSLSWAGGFSGSDGRSLRDGMLDAFDAIDQAAAVGASRLVVIAGGRNNHALHHVRRLLVRALEELGEAATAVGIQLAFEPMHPGCAFDWTFVTDIRSTLEIIGEADSPNVGLNFDTYHLGFDPTVLAWLPDIVKHIRLVQIGDGRHSPLGEQSRCRLGTGRVANAEIIRTLVECGYAGPFEVELCGEEFEHLNYNDTLAAAKEYLDYAGSAVLSSQ